MLKINADRGLVGNAVKGIGVGTLANVADKKLLQGKLTAAGISLGQNINGKPVTLNLTDALTWFVISGMKLKLSTKELITIVSTIGIKKVFEAYDYIDPPQPLNLQDPRATNVTHGRQARESNQMPANTAPYAPVPVSGGW